MKKIVLVDKSCERHHSCFLLTTVVCFGNKSFTGVDKCSGLLSYSGMLCFKVLLKN